jgi:hypothetical protein
MAGLVPAIHAFFFEDVDARNKSGMTIIFYRTP